MVDPKSVPTVKLSNEKNVPVVGLGTWQSEADGTVYKAVKCAIENGYRHIDCAYVYGNQSEIGKALSETMQAGVVKREELFIVSKIWCTYFRPDRVPICVKKILSDLNLSYLDLVLVHWPVSFDQVDGELFPSGEQGVIDGGIDINETWKALEKLVDEGLIRTIGISNFHSKQVEDLYSAARIKPVINQVESHPYLTQEKLRAFCEERGIKLTAYSPLANPGSQFNKKEDKDRLLKDEVVTRLATKYNKNAGQILIKFQTQRGVLVIPKSVTLERIISNIQIFDFELTPEEMSELMALDRGYRSCEFALIQDMKDYPFKEGIEF